MTRNLQVIGDSHAKFGWSSQIAKRTHLGPILLHSAAQRIARLRLNQLVCNPELDSHVVVICLGEIDARCHLMRHLPNTSNIQHPDNHNYLLQLWLRLLDAVVEQLLLHHPRIFRRITLALYNVVPPIHPTLVQRDDDRFPFVGTAQQRLEIAQLLNTTQAIACKQTTQRLQTTDHSIPVHHWNILDQVTDQSGWLRVELSDGHVHLSDTSYNTQYYHSMFCATNRSRKPIKYQSIQDIVAWLDAHQPEKT